MITLHRFGLMLLMAAACWSGSPAKAQPREAAIVAEVSGIWVLNGKDPVGRSQVLHEGDVVVFKGRNERENKLEPAFILFADLFLKPIASRFCPDNEHCDTTPYKAPTASNPVSVSWLQSVYAQVRPHVNSANHQTTTISRTGCQDGIGWASNGAVILTDVSPTAPGTLTAFQVSSSTPITLTTTTSGGSILGSPVLPPALYKFPCQGAAQPDTWLVVVAEGQGPEAVKQLARIRKELSVLGWKDNGWDQATADFIRDYLTTVAANGGPLH